MHPLNKAAPFSVLRPSAGGVNYAENPDPIGEHFVDNEVGEFRYDQLTRVRHAAIQVSDRIWRPLDSHRLSVVPGFEATCLLRRRKRSRLGQLRLYYSLPFAQATRYK